MVALTCALLAATVAGYLFASTRRIGIVALAVLVLLHPVALLVFLVVVGEVIYFITSDKGTNTMNFVIDALEDVLSWDLPDDATADAVTTQASLLAGQCPDELGVRHFD